MTNTPSLVALFSLQGKVAVVTGGTGVLGGAMAHGLARAGAKVGILGRRAEQAAQVVAAIEAQGGAAMPLEADVLEQQQLQAARDAIVGRWGGVDILVNAAGGNTPGSVAVGDLTFFNMERAALEQVIDLNLLGTLLPSQIFGELMARAGSGSIVNISSASAPRALTRVVGYSAAKGAIENFTRWLAVDLALKHGAGLRVNAIAPGFFVGEQNRAILLNPDGTPTERGSRIIAHTPMGRFGEPDELAGTLIWLCSDAARFVTGIVVAVDGGFAAFSGI
jgi:NAD(P)-dependent dehydrogenase (short-subunit alcohol dehydrogenase family)